MTDKIRITDLKVDDLIALDVGEDGSSLPAVLRSAGHSGWQRVIVPPGLHALVYTNSIQYVIRDGVVYEVEHV